jgi:hypothetical protein
MTEEHELVCVHSCQGWDLAQIFRSKLEAAGIPVLLKYDSASLIFGITVDSLGQVRIMVPQAYATEAEALLEDREELQEDGQWPHDDSMDSAGAEEVPDID